MLSAQCRNTKLLRSTMLSSVLRPSSVLAQIGPQHHICCLRILSVLTWFLSCLFVQSASVLPLFDSSPRVTIPVSSNSSRLHSSVHPLLRWDSFHFTHIAQHGYVYEHEWAFLSGAPAVMRITALMLRLIGIRSWRSEGTLGAEDVLLGGALATCLCNTTTIFYRLTLHHLRSPSLAFLASLLSLLPSSPATLRLAGYSEPFFTYLSYKGKSFVDLRGSHRVQRRKRHALLCSIPMVRSILLFRTCRVLSLKWHHALWVHSLGLTHRPFPCYSKDHTTQCYVCCRPHINHATALRGTPVRGVPVILPTHSNVRTMVYQFPAIDL
ncbi:hypothetical protein AcW1_003686 [Taiwanofungus camphoratus]|nr:hypothetical protein AcW1_003686 [Antrodia cinnamomea]